MTSKRATHAQNTAQTETNTQQNGEQVGGSKDRRSKRGRRQFLAGVGGASLATLAAGVTTSTILTESAEAAPVISDESIRGVSGIERAECAYRTRMMAALNQRSKPIAEHLTNGDEGRYANRIGNFSKGLPHNSLGEVDPVAYNQLLKSIKSVIRTISIRSPWGGPRC